MIQAHLNVVLPPSFREFDDHMIVELFMDWLNFIPTLDGTENTKRNIPRESRCFTITRIIGVGIRCLDSVRHDPCHDIKFRRF